jgi:hypothetical protein
MVRTQKLIAARQRIEIGRDRADPLFNYRDREIL